MRAQQLGLVLAMVLIAAVVTTAAEAPLKVHTLDNGLRVVVVENHKAPVVTVRVYVHVGSMYEGKLLGAGVSHLCEHLVAGGETVTQSEERSRQLSAAVGGQMNAYTAKDHTCYHITALSRYLDASMALLADWLMNTSITPKEFEREHGVVQRELGTRYARPQTQLFDQFTRTMFKVHPYRCPVIGYEAPLKRLTRDEVAAFYKRWYVPNNMILVVAGDCTEDAVLAKARAHFGKAPRGHEWDAVLPQEPPQLAPRVVTEEADVNTGYLVLGYRTVPLTDPDLYPLDIAAYVLGHGPSSRLVRVLRDEKQLVDSVSCWSDTPGYDAGSFVVYAALPPEKVDAARAAVVAELTRLTTESIPAAELAKAKRQKVADHLRGMQTVEDQGEQVAADVLAAHDPNFSTQYTDRIQGVTAEQVRAAARKYFLPEHLTAVAMVPKKPAPAETTAAAATAAAATAETFTLPNGVRLIVKRNPDLSLVSMAATFLGGVRADPPDKAGCCALTAATMMRGAAALSAEQIAGTLDARGASMSVSSGNNSLYAAATCVKDDIAPVLDILADVLLRPSFPEKEVAQRRQLQLAALRMQRDELRAVGMDALRRAAYDGLPYGHDELGAEDSVKGLTRDDLVQLHHRLIGANNMVLAVVGDVDPQAVREAIAARFGQMVKVPALDLLKPAAVPAPKTGEPVRVKTDKNMAVVYLGYPGTVMSDEKDRAPMTILDGVLSGIRMPRGWLFDALRGRRLVYDAQAYNWVGLDPGLFVVYAVCQPDKVDEVVRVIDEEMARPVKVAPPADEVELVKKAAATAQELDLQTNGEQALDMALHELYGLGYDYSRRNLAAVLAVTPDDVLRVARKYLHNPVRVIVAP